MLPEPPANNQTKVKPARPFAPQAVHAVRTTTIANLTMSQMGATFVVFSITIGQAGIGHAGRGHAPLALLVLGAFAFVSAIFAVAVAMPAIGRKHASADSHNVMFFGVIGRFNKQEYVARMLDNLATDETMFRMMLSEI